VLKLTRPSDRISIAAVRFSNAIRSPAGDHASRVGALS